MYFIEVVASNVNIFNSTCSYEWQ